jgi:hypothetical protein
MINRFLNTINNKERVIIQSKDNKINNLNKKVIGRKYLKELYSNKNKNDNNFSLRLMK